VTGEVLCDTEEYTLRGRFRLKKCFVELNKYYDRGEVDTARVQNLTDEIDSLQDYFFDDNRPTWLSPTGQIA
jgi:hypothetical protein